MTETNANKTLYKDGSFIADDWSYAEEGADISSLSKHFISHDAALSLFGKDVEIAGELGVIITPDDDIEDLAGHLTKIAAVAVAFPSFADGRGFSTARLLRERYGFDGQIRATGSYILDQMPMLERCGVDAFEISSNKVRAGLERGEWPEVTHYYQPTSQDGDELAGKRPWLRRKAS